MIAILGLVAEHLSMPRELIVTEQCLIRQARAMEKCARAFSLNTDS